MSTQEFIQHLYAQLKKVDTTFPDKELAEQFIDQVFNFLFLPNKKHHLYSDLEKELNILRGHLSSLVYDVTHKEEKAEKHTETFFAAIPALYETLIKDAQALLQFDPAARSVEEVLVAYPGFYATAVYRLSHQLWEQGVEILPRLFTEYAHSRTGVDIHPGAHIGEGFCIDHGTGIVIGETTVIGNNVKIYQGVTLGALHVSKEAITKRHPTIEDNVTIYAGATILGGETVIGKDSIIGGNVWLTYSVPSFSVVYHKSEVKVRDKNPFPEPLNFVI
ncbi:MULTISPECIES: serine O-acetyltransferase EpsC [Niastella]|uniref:Serine acetyltransferase n=1 Tax=Niastella soli TaxID=2821487 RepID=A0ABS3YRB5_9BACT|nr:serine O-acetyltransferase EpsC [Niastella soli]MBO9200379.1 serine acetyltransferase [Niastella soli]